MSNPLYIVVGAEKHFEIDELEQTLADIPSVSQLRRTSGFSGAGCLAGHYEFQGVTTQFESSDDRAAIVVGDPWKTGFHLALEINQRYQKHHSEALHIFDEVYSFDLVLADIPDLASLLEALGQNASEGAPPKEPSVPEGAERIGGSFIVSDSYLENLNVVPKCTTLTDVECRMHRNGDLLSLLVYCEDALGNPGNAWLQMSNDDARKVADAILRTLATVDGDAN